MMYVVASFNYSPPPAPIITIGCLLGFGVLYVLARAKSYFRGFVWGGIGGGLIAGTIAGLGRGDMTAVYVVFCAVVFWLIGAAAGLLAAVFGKKCL
jgi:hypothetical protein